MNKKRSQTIRRTVHEYCTALRDTGSPVSEEIQRRVYRQAKRHWTRHKAMPDLRVVFAGIWRQG